MTCNASSLGAAATLKIVDTVGTAMIAQDDDRENCPGDLKTRISMYLSRQSLARLLAEAKDGIDQRALDDDEYHRRHPKYQVEEYLKIVGKL